MNYFGKFDAKVSDALGEQPGSHVQSQTVHATHVPPDAVVVSDAQLLFNAEFKRAGVDLVLSGDGREVVLHDYFKGEKRAPIASPDGAHLTGDIVTALAGQVQYAQADGSAGAHQVIGHVTKLVGTATAIRNGVSVILNNGDNVEKGDVVTSGSDSTLGITFIDGTVFGLSSNARMVLNEMVYDPNGSNNSSLLSLVAGTITFVAGETAKHGDMKVDTPVATMGIRGTAVLVEIDFTVPGATPDAKFQVLVEPDGTTGSYILFDKTTLTPLAVVDKAGIQINVQNGIASQTLAPLSPEIQKLISDVFTLKFSDLTTPKGLEHFTDSIVPNAFGPVNFAQNNGAPPVQVFVHVELATTGPTNSPLSTKNHIPEAPSFQSGPVVAAITEQPNQTGLKSPDFISGQIQYFDVNTSDLDTLSVKFSSFTYQNAKGLDVTSSLNSLQLKDIAQVEATIGVVEPLTPDASGNATAIWSYSVADKAFDFLAAGETLTLTYTATVDNNYQPLDQASSQTFTITITGTNDVPVITSSQQNFEFAAAGTGTQGGLLPPLPSTATKGTLNFTDVDLTDTHTASAQLVSALLNGQGIEGTTVGQTVFNELASALTASVTTDSTGTGTGGVITWTLADLQVYLADFVPPGQSLVLTYAVTVTDEHGATSTQDVVFTIDGNEPAATVWTDTTPLSQTDGVALWSTDANWETDKAPSTLGTDDVIISNDQVSPKTPTFPVTVASAAAAKSLTMNDFADFSTAIPTLDVESDVTLTIGGALNLNTGTDPITGDPLPLTAEVIINNWGTISVGGIAELLRSSELNNYGKITFAEAANFDDLASVTNSGTMIFSQGGNFAEQSIVTESGVQSSVTNSGMIEVVSDTLDIAAGIANAGGTLQVDSGAVLEITDGFVVNLDGSTSAIGTTISGGKLKIASGGTLDIESSHGATLDGVTVTGVDATTGESGAPASTIKIGASGAAILVLDDGTTITNGNLTITSGSTLDIEAGKTGPGATLDGVNVSGTNDPSTIEIGKLGAATLLVDDGTTIANGNLTIAGGSTLDVEGTVAGGPSATLDGVNVTGTNAAEGVLASTIEIGAASSAAATLLLDGGTTIKNGDLTIASGSALDVQGPVPGGPTATLDGVNVTGADATLSSAASTIEVGPGTPFGAVLALVDGTTITGGALKIDGLNELDVESAGGATLNGVDATMAPGGLIAIGATDSVGSTLTLEGGTTITNGFISIASLIASGSVLDVEGSGATLDGVGVAATFNSATLPLDFTGTIPITTATIAIGAHTASGSMLTLKDGTTIVTGDGFGVTKAALTIAGNSVLDVESTGGATFDGVVVTGSDATGLSAASSIEIGATTPGGSVLTLDVGTLFPDSTETSSGAPVSVGTTITDGNMTIAGGSTLDVEGTVVGGPSAVLDGVNVTGTNAAGLVAASTIEIGATTVAGSTLLLDDGTSITGGDLALGFDGGVVDVEAGATGPGATLDGVAVSGTLHGTRGIVEVGTTTPAAATLLLDDGTTIFRADLHIAGGSTVDVEAGTTGSGATFEGVDVSGVSGLTPSTIEVGTTTAGTVLTLEATSIANGNVSIAAGSTLDVEITQGASLDSVAVTGVSGKSGSTIEIGANSPSGSTLSLYDGTTITNGNVSIAAGSLLDVETAKGATLDGVTVIGVDASVLLGTPASIIGVGTSVPGAPTVLVLDDGTTITNGDLNIAAGSALDVESTKGATLDGVSVTGIDGSPATGSTIEIGATSSAAATLLLDDGTTITDGNLTIAGGSTLDIEAGKTGPGATLDGVNVTGTNAAEGVAASTIEIGTTADAAATLLLDDGTTIKNGNLNIAGGSTVDVEAGTNGPGATFDGANVTGTSGNKPSKIEIGATAAAAAILLLDDATAIANGNLTIAAGSTLDVETAGGATLNGVSVSGVTSSSKPSTIEIGATTADGSTLTLEGGASIANGNLTIASQSVLDIESSTGATLNGVNVTNSGTIQVDGVVSPSTTVTLLVEGGTEISNGKLVIHDPASSGEGIVEIGTGGAALNNVTVSDNNKLIVDASAALTLEGGTSVTGGAVALGAGSTLDVETGGATLDGVTVGGVSGDAPSTIEVGELGATTLLLDDGTTITNGNLTIASGSTLDVEAGPTGPGATLDGVNVSGTNDPSTIAIGATSSAFATLLLDDGTTITSGNLTIAGGSTLDIEAGTTGPGATLDGVTVTGVSAISGDAGKLASKIEVGTQGAATLLLDDGTTITNGKLAIAGGSTLDVEAGVTGPGATLDGVSVISVSAIKGESSDKPVSTIEVGTLGATTLLLDDGTTIKTVSLAIGGGSTVDVEAGTTGPGATLDGVSVTGTNAAEGVLASTIEIGATSAAVATLLLDDGTTIANGNLTIAGGSTLDVEAGTNGPGATLDGVIVTGFSVVNGESTDKSASKIEIGTSGTATTLLLDDGTTIINGNLKIAGGSTLDVEAGASGPGATLDGVKVAGTNANAAESVVASTIDVGTTTGAATILTLDDGTTVTNGALDIANGSKLDIEYGSNGPGATLDGVNVTDAGTIQVDGVSEQTTTVNLLLDGGTTVGGGGTLLIHDPLASDQGTVEIGAGGATFDGITVTNNNILTVDSTATLKLSGDTSITGGTIDDNGTIEIAGTNSFNGVTTNNPDGSITTVDLILNAGGVTVDSGATLALDNVASIGTNFTGTDTTSIIKVDSGFTLGFDGDTLSGGTLDVLGQMDSNSTSSITGTTIVNSGNINVVTGTLTIDPSPVTNTGTIDVQSTDQNSGTLVLNNELVTNSVTVDNVTTNGTIQVDAADASHFATLDLESSTIDGGNVNIAGVLNSTGNSTGSSAINGATVTNTGTIESTAGTLTLSAANVNNAGGTIEATTAGSVVALANTTITGGTLTTGSASSSEGGVIEVVATSGANLSVLASGGAVDTNLSVQAATPWNDSGIFVIAGEQITITASGLVSFGEPAADDPPTGIPDQLAEDGKVAPGLANESLVGKVGSGTPFEVGAGTTFTATTSGELFLSIDDDYFGDNFGSWSATIAVPAVTNTGFVQIDSGANLGLQGLVINQGTIDVGPANTAAASLEILGNVALSGGGFVSLDGSNDKIVAGTGGGTLYNFETIHGAGAIGANDGALTLNNEAGATIDADVSGGTLTIETGSQFTNAGLTEATNGGTLTIDPTPVTNTGTIEAQGGSTVVLSGEIVTNSVTLNGAVGNGLIQVDETSSTSFGTLDFESSTIDGGSITVNGVLDSTGSSFIDGATITGNGTIDVTGGTLTLSGLNTFSGTTTIQSGAALAAGGAGAFSASSVVTDNGELDLGTTDQTIAALNGTNTAALVGSFSGNGAGPAVLTINDGGSFAGVIEDGTQAVATALTLAGGTLTLTGDNLYTGVTTINGGTLKLSGAAGSIAASSDVIDDSTFDISGTSGASIVTLSGTGTVNLGTETLTLSDASTTFSGAIDGSGGLTLTTGTEILSGDNLYTGVTTINGGTLKLSGAAGSIAASSDVIDDSTFDISGTSGASIVTLSGTGTVNLGTETLTLSDASTTFSGAIDGSGGLTLTTGTEILSGDNLYTGVTTINGGTLKLSGAAGSIAASSDVIDDSTFDISGTSGASIVTLSGTGTVNLGTETLTLSDASTTFSGAIDGSGGLTLTTGTEILTGDNLYTGVTTINGGTLKLSGAAGSIAASSDVIDDSTFDISGTSGASIVTLSGTGTVNLGSKTLTLSDASTTFSGAIDGSGGLTLTTGTEILSGDNLYTGVTTINGGTLKLSGAAGSIAASSDVIDDSTFDISGTSGASIVTLSGTGTVTLGTETLTLSDASTTFSGAIDGSGGLTVDGTATETLSGVNTYGGTTTIGSGETLKLSGAGSIADSSGILDNGTFDISGLTASGTSITSLSGTGKVTLGSKTPTLTAGGGSFSGAISGSGGLTVDGAGTETLSGINTYGGATTIGAGETLKLSGAGSIADSSDVIDNGTFDISGTSGASIVTLSGTGTVALGTGTLTLSDASTTFDGTISSSTGGDITVASGTLTLGAMTLDSVTLAGSFDNSGTLTIDHTVTLNGATISGGTLNISGTLDTTGTTTINDATINNSDHIDVVSGTLDIDPTPFTNTGKFEVASSAVFSGEVTTDSHGVTTITQEVVTNTNGTIQIDHGGTLTLFDTTINGGTIVDNGTLLLTGTTDKFENVTFTGTATLDISSNATFEIDGSVSSGVTANLESGGLAATTLTLNDSHHFSGTITGLLENNSNENLESRVDLLDLAYLSGGSGQTRAVYNNSTGQVTVTDTNSHHQVVDSVTLNVSGSTSGSFETTSDGHGGTYLADPATTGNVTIDSDQTLSIAAASSNTVTFTNSTANTGELILTDSKDFTGTITGFAGDGTIANSDLIDVADLNFANVVTSKTTYTENANGTGGTLTLYNASGQALDSINFNGNYQLANFTVESDANGGTLIVDPPVNGSNHTPHAPSTQNATGTTATDGFAFNFAANPPPANSHPEPDTLQPGGPAPTSTQPPSNGGPDGHWNLPVGADGHDLLNGFVKPHLHTSDFHFV